MSDPALPSPALFRSLVRPAFRLALRLHSERQAGQLGASLSADLIENNLTLTINRLRGGI